MAKCFSEKITTFSVKKETDFYKMYKIFVYYLSYVMREYFKVKLLNLILVGFFQFGNRFPFEVYKFIIVV